MRRLSHIIIALALAALLPADLFGRTVETKAGEIAKGLHSVDSDTELCIKGTIDASDLRYIAANCASLERLDLSGTDIAAYHGAPLAANCGRYPADELPAYILSGLRVRSLSLPESIISIGDCALTGAAIDAITIPSSVISIGRGVFAACASLKKIVIPASVSNAESHIFKDCTVLESIVFEAPAVPDEAFAGCTSLRSVTLGNGVNAIGERAFCGCATLTDLSLAAPSSLRSIGAFAFESSGLTTLDFSACTTLSSAGSFAFARCTELKTVSLPSSFSRLGEGIFADCPMLETITASSSLQEIPALALKGASSLSDAGGLMDEGTSAIGTLAFAGMKSMTSVKLPSSTTSIGSGAFEGCDGLAALLCESLTAVPALGNDVWAGVDQSKVELIADVETAPLFAAAEQWKEFRIRTVDGSSIESITSPSAAEAVRARMCASVLELHSELPIASVTVYDSSGRLAARTDAGGTLTLSLHVAIATGRVGIVSLTFSDGSRTAFKLINSPG